MIDPSLMYALRPPAQQYVLHYVEAARRAEAPNSRPHAVNARAPAPWISQFDKSRVERAGDTACFRACRAMAKAVGVRVPDNTNGRIQVADSQDGSARITTTKAQVDRARGYIDRQLEAGRPVTVGVSFMKAGYNRDGITGHFVLLTGRGADRNGTYYTYNDPFAPNEAIGASYRFYVDAGSGNLVQPNALLGRYEMSMVVPSVEAKSHAKGR